MKITELSATFGYHHQLVDLMFGYHHQLVDLWEKEAQKSARLKKLNNGLTLDFLNPKYWTGRIMEDFWTVILMLLVAAFLWIVINFF